MPLKLEGQYAGKKYDGIISVQEAGKIFGIEELVNRKTIQLRSTRFKPDKLNGGLKGPESVSFICNFQAVDSRGNNFTFRYYKSAVPRQDNGVSFTNYLPHNTNDSDMPFNGREIVINTLSQLELAIFYMLNPFCKTSPFHRQGSRHYYELFLPEQEAKKQSEALQLALRVQAKIFSLEIDELQILASGIVINKGGKASSVGAIKGRSIDELRVSLIQLAQTDMVQFEEQFNSGRFRMKGLLKMAVDNSIIVLSSPHTSGRTYSWKHNNQNILTVPNHLNPPAELEKHFSKNLDTMVPLIRMRLAELSVDQAMSDSATLDKFNDLMNQDLTLPAGGSDDTPIVEFNADTPADEIADYLLANDLVIFDEDKSAYYLQSEDGSLSDRALVKVQDGEVKEKKLVAAMGNRIQKLAALKHINGKG